MNQSLFGKSGRERWTAINWKVVELSVRQMQHGITKAAERKRHKRMRQLQNLLVRSMSARLLAVRKVAQENTGKTTPGIDGKTWLTPERK